MMKKKEDEDEKTQFDDPELNRLYQQVEGLDKNSISTLPENSSINFNSLKLNASIDTAEESTINHVENVAISKKTKPKHTSTLTKRHRRRPSISSPRINIYPKPEPIESIVKKVIESKPISTERVSEDKENGVHITLSHSPKVGKESRHKKKIKTNLSPDITRRSVLAEHNSLKI